MLNGYLFAVLTGVFFGIQGVYGKILTRKLSPAILAWGSFTFTIPYLLIVVMAEGIPPIHWSSFLWATFTSFSINLFAWLLFFQALEAADLAHTMPFTSFTTLFLIPVAFVLLRELPDQTGVAGILLVFLGGYGIHLKKMNLFEPLKNIFHNKGTRLMLMVALMWSVSATVEKVAVLSSSQAFYGVTINTLLALAYTPLVIWKQRDQFAKVRFNLIPLFILGSISGLLILAQFTALKLLLVSYVIAFKRAGVIISVFLGMILFKERNPLQNLFFTFLMVIGVFLIMT
ncbi:MAG: hypothetical protein Kow0042_01320 [Calditrichia bacterium]